MSNFQLYNDKVCAFPLKCFNVSTAAAAAFPTGTTIVAASSNPASLGVAIGGSPTAPVLYATPKVQASPGLTISASANGLVVGSLVVDVVADPTLLGIAIDTVDATSSQQAIPTAPGP